MYDALLDDLDDDATSRTDEVIDDLAEDAVAGFDDFEWSELLAHARSFSGHAFSAAWRDAAPPRGEACNAVR